MDPIKHGDIPASYVSLPGSIFTYMNGWFYAKYTSPMDPMGTVC